jgi:hypothetical protein
MGKLKNVHGHGVAPSAPESASGTRSLIVIAITIGRVFASFVGMAEAFDE